MAILINQDVGLWRRKSGDRKVKLVLENLPPLDLRVLSPRHAYILIPSNVFEL
jgi:hypothetical protein